jgi:subfamily B ATP-binding cassette protein MsbA
MAATLNTPHPPTDSLGQRMLRLWPYFRSAKAGIVLATGATIAGALTEPMIPALLKALLDSGFGNGQVAIWMVPVSLIGLFGLRGLAVFLAQYALAHTANQGLLNLRTAMFRKMGRAHMGLFADQSASKLSNTLVYEVQNGASTLVNALLSLAKDGLTMLALLGYLFWLNWQLTLIVLLLFPGLTVIMRVLSRRLYGITRDTQSATDELAYVVEENALAHRMLRLHGAQEPQAKRFDQLSHRLRRLAMKSTVATAAMTPLTQMLAAAALSGVISVALWQSQSSGTTVGNFVAFVTAMLMLIAPIRSLAQVAGPITRGLTALERALELIEQTPEQSGGSHTAERVHGAIEWREVWVRYVSNDNRAALQGVSLTVAPGETVALVGASGSGKTTLVNLLPRFVDPSTGSILVDGVSTDAWNIDALRRQIAMVSQDVVMLNDTLAANVALGDEQPNPDRVAQALQAANLWDLVQGLPSGIQSRVGHNATELSGGQRQRLAIARAIYKDAPILILDEATSALDNESERLVQEALARLMAGRTTLVIAHRLSTIEHADRIVVLDNGRIAEIGNHQTLLNQNGIYQRLQQNHFAG